MAAKPKVPFTLHPSMRLRASIDLTDAARVTLAPDGALVVIARPGVDGGSLDFYPRPGAPVARSIAAPAQGWWDSWSTSRDGTRYAAFSERWESSQRLGHITVGHREGESPRYASDTPRGAPITLNDQSQSAPLVALSPDGDRAVIRTELDERHALSVVDIARGHTETHALAAGSDHLFAHTYSDDGALYTACANASARGGVARWSPDGAKPEQRWEWATGCALAPARDGVWTVGARGVVWRIGPGRGGALVSAKAERLARARELRARATHKWDVAFLDHLVRFIESDQRSFTWETNTPQARYGPAPEAMDGARCFDVEFFWECAFTARLGDDALAVSDGLSVVLLHERGDTLSRTLLLDDTARCSPRSGTRRITGLTSVGDTLGVLWKKSGATSTLSLFDVGDTAA